MRRHFASSRRGNHAGDSMNTLFLLMAEFDGQAEVSLDDLCPKYTGLEVAKAKREAARQSLPFPARRATRSQKSGWLVHLQDLASYLDTERARARKEWEAINK